MADGNPIVLLAVRHFLPAYKSGGPVRTLQAMVEKLHANYSFKIVALDRDEGDRAPFGSIDKNRWNVVGPAQVRYFSPGWGAPFSLLRLLRTTPFDILYLNSIFDPIFTLAPLLARRAGFIPNKPVMIAPRGECSPGALAEKSLKKVVFLRIARLFGFYKELVLHASTETERSEIENALGGDPSKNHLTIRIARNLASDQPNDPPAARRPKSKGKLNAVFVSRVAPKKNLLAAIEILGGVKREVALHIYGPISDSAYWRRCQEATGRRRGSARIEYKGDLPHKSVLATLAQYDVFLLPTLGENFGHAILESLLAGCPPVISDQTPWRGLREKRAGWDLPLQAPERFVEVLQAVADMDEETHQLWRQGAKALGLAAMNDERALNDNKKLFAALLP